MCWLQNAIALDTANPEMAMALTTEMLLGSIAVRIDGALTHREVPAPKTPAGRTLTLAKPHPLQRPRR